MLNCRQTEREREREREEEGEYIAVGAGVSYIACRGTAGTMLIKSVH